jgi:hypothetical protein
MTAISATPTVGFSGGATKPKPSSKDEIARVIETVFDAGGQFSCDEVYDHFSVDAVLEAQRQKLVRWYPANWNTGHLITLQKAGYEFLGETPPPSIWQKALNFTRRLSGKLA